MPVDGSKSPIRATQPSQRDPLRNFKFRVDFVGIDSITKPFATMGFMSVSGLGIQTDMIPYREGGDNTITRKMPGQSEVSPLTLVSGVFSDTNKNAQMEWFKHIFAVQWGTGNAGWDAQFRCDMIIRVLNHPVTKFTRGSVGDPNDSKSAGAAFKVYNCWPAAVVYNDLNAGDNSILVTNMTVHHEGFEAFFGEDAKKVLAGRT
jgi:phage tail-like protein